MKNNLANKGFIGRRANMNFVGAGMSLDLAGISFNFEDMSKVAIGINLLGG